MPKRVVPILGGLRWEPNCPEESFEVDGGSAALVLRPHPDDPDTSSVVIIWSGVDHATFGPPNDEGRHQHALHDAGFGELLWAGEVIDDELDHGRAQHFIIPTKEGVAEVHAHQINWARLHGVTDAKIAISRFKPTEAAPSIYPEVTVDGFTMGMLVSCDDCGDAWVQAPDGGIATLIWETGSPSHFLESIPPNPAGRWGTYAVKLELPLTNNEEAAVYLRALLPDLIPRWKAWAQSR